MKRERDLRWASRTGGLLAVGVLLVASIAFAAPPPKVDSADPSTGEQGTVDLWVTIKGRNFDSSAQTEFLITGTSDPTGISVSATEYRGPETLRARITIDEEAQTELSYDIEVRLSSGRKGKGTEKFAVVEKGGGGSTQETPLCGTFRDDGLDLVGSDGAGTYCNEAVPDLRVVVGAVNGRLNLWTDGSTRQGTLDFKTPDFPVDCTDFIADPSCVTVVNFTTQHEWLDNGMGGFDPGGTILDLRSIAPGETRRVDFQANFPSESKSTSHRVIWGGSNRQVCGDPVYITGSDTDFDGETDTWEIEATANEQACFVEIVKKGNRQIYHEGGTLPFKLTLVKQ